YREYQELLLARVGLKRLYSVTLTLALLVARLSAFLLAFILSERMAAPLATLAQGTRAVALGDFSQRIPVESRDELGVLTQSFNTMTEQLAAAGEAAARHQAELAAAKAYLESLLAHLSTGVMSFDRDLHLRSANPSASAILQADLDASIGVGLRGLPQRQPALAPVAEAIASGFDKAPNKEWESQVSVARGNVEKTLMLRGTALGGGGDDGYVVVFDDISDVIQ